MLVRLSLRLMNAMLVGITRRNSDMQRISECDASVDRVLGSDELDVLGSDELDAQMSFDGSLNANLFGEQDVQKAFESRNLQVCSMYQYIPVQTSICWYVLVFAGMYWSVLVCTCIGGKPV